MALIVCKECGRKMIAGTTSCPRCGSKMSEPAQQAYKRPRHALAIGVIAVIAIGMFAHYAATRYEPNDELADGTTRAIVDAADRLNAAHVEQAKAACKRFIERSLHDPANAEWPPMRDFAVEKLKENVFRIQAEIRGKNAFNATRLATFDCVVRDAGDSWQAIRVEQLGSR